MCRVVVWAKPRPGQDHQRFDRGEVVDILEDGQSAGTAVEKGDWWRVIEVPGKTVRDMALLLGGDPRDEVPILRPELPRLRVYRVDLDAIEKKHGLRQFQKPDKALVEPDLELVRVQPLADPRVIGE